MAQYKIEIRRVEYYSYAVVVEANNQNEAVKKVEKAWENDPSLYEKVTDNFDDTRTQFIRRGRIAEPESNYYRHIE